MMEKARLIVKETKKKKIIAELHFIESNKSMPFPQAGLKDTSLNGSEVEVERIGGKIVKVQAGERIIFLALAPRSASSSSARPHNSSSHTGTQTAPVKTQGPLQNEQIEHIRNAAHAPYNFVPLNDKVVEVNKAVPEADRYHDDEGRQSGWIELAIETKTPLYIRGALSKEELEAGKDAKEISDFFAPGAKLRIPGSSLRGMVRTLVEMSAFGAFGAYDDKLLYYRALADKSNLRKEYQEHMSSYDRKKRKANYKMSAGVLQQAGNGIDFEILPSAENFRSILKHEAKARIGKRYRIFNFYKLDTEYLVVSGDMQKKKRDWLVPFPAQHASGIPVHEDDVKHYRNDSNRAAEVPNLIELAAKGQQVPCFYSRWRDSLGRERVSFGHTPMFRLAYQQTIGEHVPLPQYKITKATIMHLEQEKIPGPLIEKLKVLLQKDFTSMQFEGELARAGINPRDDQKYYEMILGHARIIDFAEAIFGNEHSFAGRVFFEDAFLDSGQGEVLMGERTPQILASPKPTTFQHYLVQSSGDIRRLNHYNSNSSIRGNKLYWHKSGEGWEETNQKAIREHHTQYTSINPVKPETTFTGCIRFENLSDEELGAVLFVLNLPEGCLHKLGMGKPLGLGSVTIKTRLYLSDRQQRYADLFCEWNNVIPESDAVQEKIEAFESYLRREIGHEGSLWETERLQELRIMLNYQEGLKRQMKNSYMKIEPNNQFKNRPVLPKPSNV